LEQNIELGNMNIRNRSSSRHAQDPFRDQSPDSRQSSRAPANATTGVTQAESDDAASTRTGLTGQTLTAENAGSVPPQRIRSMLDI